MWRICRIWLTLEWHACLRDSKPLPQHLQPPTGNHSLCNDVDSMPLKFDDFTKFRYARQLKRHTTGETITRNNFEKWWRNVMLLNNINTVETSLWPWGPRCFFLHLSWNKYGFHCIYTRGKTLLMLHEKWQYLVT